jgi:hypothetical protein
VAAAIAARRKNAAYPEICVLAFAVEDHGRLGEDALMLARLFAPSEPSARSLAIRRLYQGLGNTLQRYAADAVMAATAVRRGA